VTLSFPREHSRLTKRKTKYPTATGLPAPSRWLNSASAFLPAFLPAFPKTAPSQNYRAFLHSQCFPEHTNQTPESELHTRTKPKRVSQDKPIPESLAHLRTQTYAQCPNHMPGSSTHTQSYKQACSRKLSEQRKYRESMPSSTIFSNTLRGGGVDEVIYRYELSHRYLHFFTLHGWWRSEARP